MVREASKSAFVIMPFAPEFCAGYEDVIKPGTRAAGLEPERADEQSLGHIHGMMLKGIFESPVVIADVSNANPNVLYELGISHTTARKTITLVREDYSGCLPFDLAPYRVLIYPKRPDDSCSDEERETYEKAASDAKKSLAEYLAAILEDDTAGIDNPVQDFLAKRSPLTRAESTNADSLKDTHEEQMIANADSDILAVGITGAHFVKVLGRVIHGGARSTPLSVRLLTLDPEDRNGWRYVYHLREGRALPDDEFERLFAEDRVDIQRTSRLMETLNNESHDFHGEILYYTGIPVFWAYVVDSDRMFVGNLSMNRFTIRLPVSILVKDDPRTRSLYRYYRSAIDVLMRSQPRSLQTSP